MWEAAPLSYSLVLHEMRGSARKAAIVLVPTGRVGTLYPSSAPAGEPTLSGAPLSPCFAAESTREGTLMSLPEGIATLRSSLAPHAEGRCRPKVTSGCPKRSEGGCPCRNEDERRPSSNATYHNEKCSFHIFEI